MFAQLPSKSSRTAKIIFSIVAGLPFAEGVLLSFFFESPEKPSPDRPLVVHAFAPKGTACTSVPDIVGREDPRHVLPNRIDPCMEGNPRADPSVYSKPGEITVVLDPDLPTSGRTIELRSGRDRYFVVRINPLTYDSVTWLHEVGGHLLQGHTAIRIPSWLAYPTNVLLDTLYVDPYILLGDRWRVYIACSLLLAVLIALSWSRRSGV
jgi:hypothetical protein